MHPVEVDVYAGIRCWQITRGEDGVLAIDGPKRRFGLFDVFGDDGFIYLRLRGGKDGEAQQGEEGSAFHKLRCECSNGGLVFIELRDGIGAETSFSANLHKKEIPSLYGLRGIAALTVVFFHTLGSMHLPNVQRWFPGDEAVALFFELSGLLITWLLLKEKTETGSIHLKQFYERRILRLFPAFYLFWLLCLPIHPIQARWWTFFYLRDIWSMFPPYAPGAAVFSIAWSLGVEEKFYLLWPWLLRKFRGAHLPPVLLGLGVLDQLYRLVVGVAGYTYWSGYGFETHLDGILFGSALAIAAKQGWTPPRWMAKPVVLLMSLAIIELMPVLLDWPHTVVWGTSICALPLLLLLIYVVANPPRLLNNPVAKFFGNISYSLYLYHLLVIYLLRNVHFAHWRYQIAVTVGLSISAGAASYYAIEKPFLRLKKHFEFIKTR